MSNQLKTLSLKCPSCGAALEITSEMDRFACGFCGTEQIVQRQGGTVVLKLLGDAIARVQLGTDRTAAELALRRLREDMAALEQERLQVRPPPPSKDTNSKNTVSGLIFIVLFLLCSGFLAFGEFGISAIIFMAMIVFIINSITSEAEHVNAHAAKQQTEFENRSKALTAKINEQLKLLEP